MTGPAPLDGVRVLDFSRVLAGPHAGRMLVDLGADVVKVEPPEGDLTRFAVPRVNSLSVYFIQQNCGKRNVSLDLARPEAVEALLRVAEGCDVVLENFRPGVMERMGLGYEAVRARNPRVVYASISGYGDDGGPWRDRRAYAPVIHAESGVMLTTAEVRGSEPMHDTFSHADVYSGLECVSAVLAALYQRERTGRGQHVDVAMTETMLCVNEHTAIDVAGLTREDELPTLGRGRNPIARTGDGRYVTVASDPTTPGAFPLFCRVMGRDDLVDDPRFATTRARLANRDALLEIIRAFVGGFDSVDQVEAAFGTARLATGQLRSTAEVAGSEWAAARGALVPVDDRGGGTIGIPNSPWRFSDATTGVRGRPAYRGEHNRQVLREMGGFSDVEVDDLEASGVLSARGPTARS